ncbi:MAG TPA: hypothetical protein VNC22_03690 [Sporichthya sp.]|jgi:hypothetical protein|nr:hypothetical protein [Sporichthya sp.]
MTMTPRPVDVVRLGLGLGTLTRPEVALRLSGGRTQQHERTAIRILGARFIAQSVMGIAASRSQRRPPASCERRPCVRELDVAIEVTHAATMLALAVASAKHRRLALVSAVTALGFSALDLQEVRR